MLRKKAADDIGVKSCKQLKVHVAQVIAMKAPGFGERKSSYLEDIAILTGAQVVKEELGLSLDKVLLSPLLAAAQCPAAAERLTVSLCNYQCC